MMNDYLSVQTEFHVGDAINVMKAGTVCSSTTAEAVHITINKYIHCKNYRDNSMKTRKNIPHSIRTQENETAKKDD